VLDGLGEGGGPGEPQHLAERGFEESGAGVLAPGVDGEDGLHRGRSGGPLRPDAVDHGRKPTTSVMTDEQDSDGGNHDPEP
jgi:hypothetical protein